MIDKNTFDKDGYSVVRVDFRDALGPAPSPFLWEAKDFLRDARRHLASFKDKREQHDKALKITNDWLDMLGTRDLVDEGHMLTDHEMADLTGMSMEEVYLLEATAYAETLGLNITKLEQAAAHYNIYGPHFPFQRSGGQSYHYGGDLRASPE